jgi:hypothetical protein
VIKRNFKLLSYPYRQVYFYTEITAAWGLMALPFLSLEDNMVGGIT